MDNALWPLLKGASFGCYPSSAVVVSSEEAMARHVPKTRDVGQGPLELGAGQVKGVVVEELAGILKGLKQEANFAQIPVC